LNGVIFDASGGVVVGAQVTVKNTGTAFGATTATNDTGFFSFPRIPVGGYELTVEKDGFKPLKRTGLFLAVGAVGTLNLTLEVGAAGESVTVTGESPLVETTRSQTSTVVDARLVRDLPVNGRNFLDFALLTPAVVADPTRAGDLAFAGQRGTANSLMVDGGDSNNLFFGQSSGRAGVRNPYSFSQESVQEFQVNTNGYSAEVGRAGGGVINVVTKSGTNELHGSGFWFFRDRAMNANTFVNNARRLSKPLYHYHQFGGSVGGPVQKDRVFFFYSYDGQRNKDPNPVYLQIEPGPDPLSQRALQEISPYLKPYTTQRNNDIHLVKFDWNLGPSQRVSMRYNAHRFHGKNFENAGITSAAEHTGDSNIFTDHVTLAYNRSFAPATVWDVRFNFLRDDEPGQANSSAPETQINENGLLQLQFGRNNFSPRYTNTKRYQMIQTLSQVRGRHTVKYGGDINVERIDNYFPGNFGGSYAFASYADFAARRPSRFTQAFSGGGSGPLSQPHVTEYAFFIADSWRFTEKLTINIGARYDLAAHAQPKILNADPALMAMGLRTDHLNRDSNNVAGRVGFAYKLTQDGRTVMRGGYGTFYGRTPAIMTGTATTQNGIQVQTYTLTSNLPIYPSVLTAPPALNRTPDIYVFAPDYVQPQTHQWSFNIEREFRRNYALTLGYLGVHGVHLSRTRDINLYPAQPLVGTIAGGGVVEFYRHPGRPNPAFGRISLFESGADSVYHGGFIQLTKRFSNRFQLQTSYTFSKVIDTMPDQTSVVPQNAGDDAKVAQDTLRPNLDRGLGEADYRHRFVFSGIWDITYARALQSAVWRHLLGDYQISILSNVRSGRHFSETVGGDPNNDGNIRTDRTPGVGRNTIEGPGFASVDLRVSRDIRFRNERWTLRLLGEAFNLSNRANFSALNQARYNFSNATRVFTPNPSFGVRTNTFDPRILQLAAKIIF